MRDPARGQHLSDEAVAACADNVLSGGARQRAERHVAACPDCAYAVAVQRQAVWALRAAPAPALPTGLLDRLRDVPVTTPIERVVPSHVDEHGTAMFATFAAPMAAFVEPQRIPGQVSRWHSRRVRAAAITAASVAVVGAIAGTAVADSHSTGTPNTPAQFVKHQLDSKGP